MKYDNLKEKHEKSGKSPQQEIKLEDLLDYAAGAFAQGHHTWDILPALQISIQENYPSFQKKQIKALKIYTILKSLDLQLNFEKIPKGGDLEKAYAYGTERNLSDAGLMGYDDAKNLVDRKMEYRKMKG